MDKVALVVLVAGKGTRMLPLTLETPKPMLKVAGKNLIERKLELLPSEVDEVILVIGYLGEQISGYFGDEWHGKRICYVTQEVQDGTAGALWVAKELLPQRFIVMMGDDLYAKEDVTEILRHDCAMLVTEVSDRTIGGEVLVGSDGTFIGMNEPRHHVVRGLINTGMYMLNRNIFEIAPVRISEGSPEFGLPHTLLSLAKSVRVDVVRTKRWFQVTSPEDLTRAEEFLA